MCEHLTYALARNLLEKRRRMSLPSKARLRKVVYTADTVMKISPELLLDWQTSRVQTDLPKDKVTELRTRDEHYKEKTLN